MKKFCIIASILLFLPILLVSAGASSSEVTITMNGQSQEGNGNFKHFINHRFYSDKDSTELPPLNARRLFSIINIYIGVPPGDYKAAVLQTDNLLITEAKLNMATGELTPSTVSTTQVLTLKNIHISTRQTPLVLCVPIIPCDMTGHQFSVKVYDDKGNVYAVGGDFKGNATWEVLAENESYGLSLTVQASFYIDDDDYLGYYYGTLSKDMNTIKVSGIAVGPDGNYVVVTQEYNVGKKINLT